MSPLLASLLHTLWIGLLVWAATRLALRATPPGRPDARHTIALGAVLLLFVGWGVAWMTQSASQPAPRAVSPTIETTHTSVSPEPRVETAPTTTSTPPAAGPSEIIARVESLRRAAALQTWLEALWLGGVLIGLARIAVGLRANGAHWLARQTTAPLPPVWAEAWSGQIKTLAERFKARLVAIEAAGAPFVVGLVEPVIVVPLAACAGVTPELARAALAHELAHIARRDWLVEVLLRVVEALLFFNPFVWLLARQVRAEREACCDAWACECIAMPRIKFAEALLDWGRRFTPVSNPTTQGLALDGKDDGLRGRIERLLGGAHGSRVRARTWKGAAGVLLVVVIGLTGYGTALTFGATALRDHERTTLLEQASAPYLVPDVHVKERAGIQQERIVSGRVVDEAGDPVASANVHLLPPDPRWETSATTGKDGRFTSRRPLTGALRITVRAPGKALHLTYADADEAELREPITLNTGHDVHVVVLDAQNHPLTDAQVSWTFDYRGQNKLDRTRTDTSGRALVRHLPDNIPVYLQIEAANHATLGQGPLRVMDYSADSPLAVRLQSSGVTTLRVIFDDDETPVANARVRVGASTPGWSQANNPYPSWSYGGIRTDPDGVVRLEHLRPDVAYRLAVESTLAESASVALEPGHVGEKTVRLARLRPLRVRLINFPDTFHGTAISLSSTRVIPALNTAHGDTHQVKLNDQGAGETSIKQVGTGRLFLRFQDKRLRALDLVAKSAAELGDELVIDYESLPQEARSLQRVAIRFMHGDRRLFPAGRFYIHRLGQPHVWDSDGFTLDPGKPLFAEWIVGTRLKPTSGWAMIGATIDLEKWGEDREIVIDAQTTEIVVPVKPAGMIRAQVLDADGALVRGAYIHAFDNQRDPSKRTYLSFSSGRQFGEWQASGPVDFALGNHRLWGAEGFVFALSPPAKVSANNPMADVVVRLPRSRRYELRLTDEAGRPAANIGCRISLRFADHQYPSPSNTLLQLASDLDGRVVFDAGEDLVDWKGLVLMLEASGPGRALTRVMVPAQTMNAPTPIRLLPAVAFTGRVVNRATGLGIPGITVHRRIEAQRAFAQERGVLTNADGRFVFTDFAAGQRFRLYPEWPTRLGLRPESSPTSEYTPTDTGVVIYMVPH